MEGGRQIFLAVQEHREQKVIAFMLTCACVDLHATLLKNLPAAKGLQVNALHGRMKQSQRQATLQAFATQRSGIVRYMISTSSLQDCHMNPLYI